MLNESNPSKAEWKRCVNNMCKSCIYDPADRGTWREQVTRCSVTECPLWRVRPISRREVR